MDQAGPMHVTRTLRACARAALLATIVAGSALTSDSARAVPPDPCPDCEEEELQAFTGLDSPAAISDGGETTRVPFSLELPVADAAGFEPGARTHADVWMRPQDGRGRVVHWEQNVDLVPASSLTSLPPAYATPDPEGGIPAWVVIVIGATAIGIGVGALAGRRRASRG